MLPVVAGSDLPRQFYAHSKNHDPKWTQPENFRPVVTESRWVKPKPGEGLWTSPAVTWDGDTPMKTEWTQWCEWEKFDHANDHLTEIIPNPRARVLRIDSLTDLRSVLAVYPGEPLIAAFSDRHIYPAWERIGPDGFAAVWLTDRGQSETRYSQPGLYGFDMESVVWLRPEYSVGRTW